MLVIVLAVCKAQTGYDDMLQIDQNRSCMLQVFQNPTTEPKKNEFGSRDTPCNAKIKSRGSTSARNAAHRTDRWNAFFLRGIILKVGRASALTPSNRNIEAVWFVPASAAVQDDGANSVSTLQKSIT